MAINKTLYVRDEDSFIWDRAKEIVGESLSSYITVHLKGIVAMHDAEAQGYQRIILNFTQVGLPRLVAFSGKWLISPEARFFEEDWRGEKTYYALALTAKGRIAVFNFDKQQTDGTFVEGELQSYDSFEQANLADGGAPTQLIAEAMQVKGVSLEELDI